MILHPIIDLLKRIVIALPDYAGGGVVWELIADYTSDDVATIVTAELPQEYQTENVYKVMITANYKVGEYPYFGVNGQISTQYEAVQRKDMDHIYTGYIVKMTQDNSPTYGLAISRTMVFRSTESAAQSVSIKSYYPDAIKAGCNIKIWRLVE